MISFTSIPTTVVDSLGWLLVHSLWQFTVIALVVFGIDRLARQFSRELRYWLLVAGLLLMVASPLVTYWMLGTTVPTVAEATEHTALAPELVTAAPGNLDVGTEFLASSEVSNPPPRIPEGNFQPLAGADRSAWLADVEGVIAPWLRECVALWFTGVLLFALRPIGGWITSYRLRSRAVSNVPERLEVTFRRSMIKFGLRPTISLLQSAKVRIPMVVGYLKPVILLPIGLVSELPPSQIEAIILHELAHIRRHDYLINVLQTLVETAFFYHPGVWWLSAQIRHEREVCCDEMAARALGSRVDYGRALLAVEELRGFTPVLAQAANGGSLLSRIQELAQVEKRKTSGAGGLAMLVLFTALASTLSVWWVQPAESADGPTPGSEPTYSGQVTDAKGAPLGDASLWLSYGRDPRNLPPVVPLGRADATGQFSFQLDPEVREAIAESKPGINVNLVAKAPRHGLDWLPLDVFHDNPADSPKRDLMARQIDKAFGDGRFASRTLRLPEQVKTVRGRLVDLQGRPLPQVTLRVQRLSRPDITILLQAFKQSSKDLVYEAINKRFVPYNNIFTDHLQSLLPPVTTRADGTFTMDGIGSDQLAAVTLHGGQVHSQQIHILGREMAVARVPHIPGGNSQELYAGFEFSHAVGPAVPVRGIVKDYDTGAPIPNTLVFVERLFQGNRTDSLLRLDANHIKTRTDENGEFVLEGMPPGRGHHLNAIPPKDSPYLLGAHELEIDLDQREKLVEIQLKRGIWLEGRVTDKTTGQPLEARVDYLALRKNPNTLDKIGLRQGWEIGRYFAGEDGHFRVLGLPGPGVLLVRGVGNTGYPLAVGAENVDGYQDSKFGGGYIPTAPIGLPLSNWHFIKQVDPEQDGPQATYEIELDAGQSIPCHVTGPDGSPVPAMSIFGAVVKHGFWQPKTGGDFLIEGYDGEGPRQLFVKSQDERFVGQVRLEGPAPSEISVQLRPAVRVTGRLIETETNLPADGYSLHCRESSLGQFRVDLPPTDEEGRFEISGLLPGVVYEMDSSNRRRFSSGRNQFTIDLRDAKPGDVIDLGNVTGSKQNKD